MKNQLMEVPHYPHLFYKPLYDIGNCTAMLYKQNGNEYISLGRVFIKSLFDGSCQDELANLDS